MLASPPPFPTATPQFHQAVGSSSRTRGQGAPLPSCLPACLARPGPDQGEMDVPGLLAL